MPRIIVLFFFLNTILCGFSQTFTNIPSWVKVENIKENNVDANSIRDGYYYALVDEQYNTVLKHDFCHYATKATSELGLDYTSQLEIEFDPSYQKVEIHYIKINRGQETIDLTHTSGIKLLKEENERSNGVLNETNTLYANLSDIRKGDIVEYAYSVIGYNNVFKNAFSFSLKFGYSIPVGRINRSLIIDKETKLSILNTNCEIQPEISENKNITYTWVAENTTPIKLEDNTPSWYSPYPTVQVSNSKDWKEVKEKHKTLFVIGKYDNIKLTELTDSIKAKYPGDIEKQISSLVDFAQNQIRYSGITGGIHSHQPHLPDYVMRNRYGDCKDKTLFLRELLKQIDIKSYPVLIHTDQNKSIESGNPSTRAFNHVILAIEYEHKFYFIDPTFTYQKGNFKNKKTSNYEVGLILDDSENTFVEIPTDTVSKIIVTEDFNINSDTKDAILKVESIYTGIHADRTRYSYSNSSIADMQENYRSFYLKYTDEVEVLDTLVFIDDEEQNEIRITEHYLLKGFWTKADSADTKIQKDFIPYVLNEKIIYVTDNIRKQYLEIPFPVNITQTINVRKAEGWNIENSNIEENNDFFYYYYNTTVIDNLLSLKYIYRSKTSSISPEDYPAYKTKSNFLDHNMVMAVSTSDVNAKVFGFNWLLALTTLISTIFSFIVCYHLYKKPYQAEYDKQYNTIGGWLILVGIGIVISPLALTYEVFKLYYDELSVNYFFFYFDKTSEYYEPLQGYYVLVGNLGNMFLIVASVFLIILFFKRKASFRTYYCGYRIFNLIFLILDLILIYAFADNPISTEDKILMRTETAAVVKMFIQSAIWIPYVWFSDRSRHTFVEGDMPEVNQAAEETPL